ncbi:MAG: hypothetical protein HRF50_05575 [Phycisphaerae bacterium]
MNAQPETPTGQTGAQEAGTHAFNGEALSHLLSALIAAARRDPSVRDALRQAAQWLLEVSQEPVQSAAPAAELTTRIPPPAPAEPQVQMPLRIGDAQIVIPVRDDGSRSSAAVVAAAGPSGPRAVAVAPPSAPDLALVKRRVALKAECCRWAIERRRRRAEQADFETSIKPRDHELVATAKSLPNCYVWPLDPYVSLPSDEVLERAAQCYENLQWAADFALAVRGADPESDMLAPAYLRLAEAQSAVRSLMLQLELREDADQYDAFQWLKRHTELDQIYVERYMKRNDPADPARAGALADAIEQTRAAWEARRQSEAAKARLFNRARYHARRLVDRDAVADRGDWQRLYEAVIELVDSGLPPSNAELRELLLPIVDRLPEDLGDDARFHLVLRELDRYLASRERERPPTAPEPQDENVQRVRELLRGTTVVLIGGERRDDTAERLRRTFELDELRWISTREHQSTAEFEPAIARPEVALVLLAIRWASHSFEDVADMCARYEKAFVRLPGGYGARQIAHQALQQASGVLAAGRSRMAVRGQ